MANKLTKRQFIATVQTIPGTFKAMTGGAASASVSRDYNGGSSKPDLLSGPAEHEDLELTRTYDTIDEAWLSKYRKLVGRARFTVSKQATDMNHTKIGKPLVYPDCLLIGLAEPEVDSSSSDPGDIVLTFATTGPA